MPVYKRPQRTIRAINSIKAQIMDDFQAFVMGDGCPDFKPVMTHDRWYPDGYQPDRRFITFNTRHNYGGCGYWQTNYAIQHADAPYFCFMANDDIIHPGHLHNYLHAIEDTNFDFVYFDYMQGNKKINAKIKKDRIGHCALVIRTAFLRRMPPHSNEYGHDNILIDNMIKAGAKYAKAENFPATYRIMNYNRQRIDLEGLD